MRRLRQSRNPPSLEYRSVAVSDARAVAEETARASYGRLLAWISARTGDLALAEDVLSEAFRAALEHWPQTGVPKAPEAWIVTVAKRKLIDGRRRDATRNAATQSLMLAAEELECQSKADSPFPDERLKLLFICAHPAIDQSVRTPLMLQTVLGLDANRIASAFLTSPRAMSARLVRAKRKIKTAAIPFEEPSLDSLEERLLAVLDAIYAAFSTGWDTVDTAQGGELTSEAIFLAKLLTELLPEEPETWGLLSLVAHAQARRSARRQDGSYVPLNQQKIELWDHRLINIGEDALSKAWKLQRLGRFQLEAAIQSAHANSRLTAKDVSDDILVLYEKLLKSWPSVGAEIGYAAALSNANRNKDAFDVLECVDRRLVDGHQPYWAVRAHVLSALNHKPEASDAYDRAIGLSTDEAARRFLIRQKGSQV